MDISNNLVFSYPPDWTDNFLVDFTFETAVAVSQRYKEQRTALRETPHRTFKYSVSLNPLTQQILNDLKHATIQAVPIWVPIWTEPIMILKTYVGGSDSLQTEKTWLITVPTLYVNWDVQIPLLPGAFLLVDNSGAIDSQGIVVDSFNSQYGYITLDDWLQTLNLASKSTLYQMVSCYLDSMTDNHLTDSLHKIQLIFKEI